MIFKNQDEKLKKRCSISENDDFWELSDITPPKMNKGIKAHRETDVESVLVQPYNEERYTARSFAISKREEYKEELLLSYTPEKSLLTRVDVYTWPSKYTFYERFMIDAHRFFGISGEKTEPVKYFSYMPSYMQMSLKQKKWYFYWRSCVRMGKYLPTDSSYVLLYVYEIINLPDLIPAEQGINELCDVWKNYRESYTKLDKYMSEWVCDYCLINKLEFPFQKTRGFLEDAFDICALKQFYTELSDNDAYSALLFRKACSYKWWKSKYINDENRSVFEKHINAAFSYAVKRLASADGRFDGNSSGRLIEKKAVRDAYSGSLCAYNVKRRIDVTYLDIANIGELGFVVTDMVRYCENRVRAHFGLRARLMVQNLTEQHKRVIDEYFDKYLPPAELSKGKKNSRNIDLDYYEEEKPFSVSFDKAREIERASWQTTDRLTEDMFDEEDFRYSGEEYIEQKTERKKNGESVEAMALDVSREGLSCIAKGDLDGFMRIAEESYMLPETLVECVNELCYEILGDVGVEERDGRYILISDYEQEIKEWLNL